MLEPIAATLTLEGKLLVLSCAESEIGSMYDDNARALELERPSGFESDNLLLYFSNGYMNFAPVDLGLENRYVISNALTQTETLKLEAAFFRGAEELAHSNVIAFSLRPSLSSGCGAPPEPWSDPVAQLAERAHAAVSPELEEGWLHFYNLAGKRVGSAHIPGGDGMLRYTHTQVEPATQWNVQHNLGKKYVNAKLIRADGAEIFADLAYEHSTVNLLAIRMAEPASGTAYITF